MGFSIVCKCVYSSVVSVHLGEGGGVGVFDDENNLCQFCC